MKKHKSKIAGSRKISSQLSDRVLMKGIQNADNDSFHQIYRKFSRPLKKYAFRRTHSTATADELTQDVFLKIYQSSQTYNPHFDVSTWIWAIAKNTLYDYYRRTQWKEKLEVSRDELPGGLNLKFQGKFQNELRGQVPFEFKNEWNSGISPTPIVHQDVEDAESKMIKEGEKIAFHDLVAQLPERQKKVLFLRILKHSSYREISSQMNMSVSAVKSILSRVKDKLRQAHLESQDDTD